MPHLLLLPSWYPVDPSDIRGCFFREQAIALRKAGHKVGVIHPNLRSLLNRKRILIRKFGYESVSDTNVPTYQYHNLKWFQLFPHLEVVFELRFWKRLYCQYVQKNGKPDLVHVHSMLNAGIFAEWLLEEEGIPFLITEHSSIFLRRRLRLHELDAARSISGKAVKRLGVSRALCDKLEATFENGNDPWEELPNMVDSDVFNPQNYPKRRKDGEFIFLCIASLWKNKGIDFLLRAFAQKFSGDPGTKLVIGGAGPHGRTLKRLAGSLGIESRVEFTGGLLREAVPELLAKADTFVLPSLYETFGVVIVEALMMGMPVVATTCGGPESIVHENNGLLVPVGDSRSLADAMALIRTNRQGYDPDWIRKDAINRFSVDSIVRRLGTIYKEVPGIENSKPG